MASARKLIEGIDDPESFDVQGHLTSPVARIAATSGFTRDDRSNNEERWIKKLSNGKEVWLRSRPVDPDLDARPFDPKEPHTTGGRPWELVEVSFPFTCSHCRQERKGKTGSCPHCKQKVPVNKERRVRQMAQANEMAMSYLLGAFLQRLATWPADMPKPTLEARKPKVPLPDLDDPTAVVNTFVASKVPYLPEYSRLARIMEEHPEMYVSGRVNRTDHHYVHQYTTSFSLDVGDVPDEIEEEVGKLADKVEQMIQEECVSINKKIYKALEREHEWLTSDEAIDDTIAANEWTFDEDGDMGGDLSFDQLSPEAKAHARDDYRDTGLDYEWWDHIYEEWTAELQDMGFGGIDISFSGFWSQGDGASFTATSFDFLKWANWHMSSKPVERGHPYTDDLPPEKVSEAQSDDPDDPAVFLNNLDKIPDHEMINTSSPPPSTSKAYSCACGMWSVSGLANNEVELSLFNKMAKSEFDRHVAMTTNTRPDTVDKLRARNWINTRRLKEDATEDADDPQRYIDDLPAAPKEGELVSLTCPNCGKTRVREWPKPPLKLDPVCCGRRPRQESDDPELARIRKRITKSKREREAAELAANPEIQALDDPALVLSQEIERRSEPIKKLEVRGRRWYRRGAGGVYCKAYIYINDKLIHVTPEQYGYGDHYLTLAKDWLLRNGYLEGLLDDERDPLWVIRDKHKIDLQYGVRDVPRERDL